MTANDQEHTGAFSSSSSDPHQAVVDRWHADPMGAFLKWKATQRVHGRELAAHTVQQYSAMLGVYLEWLAKHRQPFMTIREDGIDQFLTSLAPRRPRHNQASAEVAPSTRRRYLTLLNGIYEHLRLMGVRDLNPCTPLLELDKHQANHKPAPAILRPAAVKRFIDWSNDQPIESWMDVRDRALRLIFLASGISVAEARALKVQDIIWDESDTIPMGLDIAAHGFVKARVAPILDLGQDALAQWIRARETILNEMGMADIETLFVARVNDPNRVIPAPVAISAPELFNIIQEASEAAGHNRSRQGAQTLRNTFVARMLQEGHDEATVARWLGLASTEQVFTIGRLVPHRKAVKEAA